jgi:hypothetical protein
VADSDAGDIFEEDEAAEQIATAFARGENGVSAAPMGQVLCTDTFRLFLGAASPYSPTEPERTAELVQA